VKRKPKDILFVSIQLILFFAYLFRFSPIDFEISSWLQYIGLFFSITGMIIGIASLLALNRNLSIFPTPKQTAELIQSGIYKYIRHPIYTGVLFFVFGYALYSENTLRMIISVSLYILFKLKATYEEELLHNKFANYSEYKKTSGTFLPKI